MKNLYLSLICVFTFCSLIHSQEIMLLKTDGKVVIGDPSLITTPGDYNLYVENGILTERVKVSLKDAASWSDDEFENTPSIDQMEKCISKNKHLKGMPSAEELVKNGYEVVSMDAKLLAQIEWLWQHTIILKKENKMLKEQLSTIKEKLKIE